MSETPTCATCRHYVGGICFVRPPTVQQFGQHDGGSEVDWAVRPSPHEDDPACKEHLPKQPESEEKVGDPVGWKTTDSGGLEWDYIECECDGNPSERLGYWRGDYPGWVCTSCCAMISNPYPVTDEAPQSVTLNQGAKDQVARAMIEQAAEDEAPLTVEEATGETPLTLMGAERDGWKARAKRFEEQMRSMAEEMLRAPQYCYTRFIDGDELVLRQSIERHLRTIATRHGVDLEDTTGSP